MTKNCRFLKLCTFLPAILVMIVIFWFSSQPADDSSMLSISFSLTLVKNILHFLNKSMSETDLLLLAQSIHGFIRKAAHFSEYALLALTFVFPFFLYNKKEKKDLFLILLLCFLYSWSDELHQMFVPGRACRFLDVCIDTSGSALMLLIVTGLRKLTHFILERFVH